MLYEKNKSMIIKAAAAVMVLAVIFTSAYSLRRQDENAAGEETASFEATEENLKESLITFLVSNEAEVREKDIEIFDIGQGKVVKKVEATRIIQELVKDYLINITDIYVKFNPIPSKGFMVRVYLQTPVQVQNQWVNNTLDEVIILYPEGQKPYLMVFENGRKPIFLNFTGDTDKMLEALNYMRENGE